jgi:hypothetical protein
MKIPKASKAFLFTLILGMLALGGLSLQAGSRPLTPVEKTRLDKALKGAASDPAVIVAAQKLQAAKDAKQDTTLPLRSLRRAEAAAMIHNDPSIAQFLNNFAGMGFH